jgi:hypothetical protein
MFAALAERLAEERELAEMPAGIIASVIANVNRDSKKQPTPYAPTDFMPSYKKKPQTTEEQIALFEGLARAKPGE